MKFNSKTLWLAAIPCLSAVLAAALAPPMARMAWPVFDQLQRWSCKQEPQGVALVLVDQESLNRLAAEGVAFPWPRELFGGVATVAKAAGARALAFDILFTEPSAHGPHDDLAFARLLREAAVPAVFPAPSASGTIGAPTKNLAPAATALGAVDAFSDTGVYRHAYQLRADGTPSLALASFRLTQSREMPEASSERYLRYYCANSIPWIPFYNVIKEARKLMEGAPLGESFASARGKVWMVGYSAPGLLDLKPTPIEPKAPGSLVHATMVANFFSGEGLYPLGKIPLLALGFLLSLFSVALILLPKAPTPSLVLGPALLIVGALAATALLWSQGLWLNPIALSTACAPGALLVLSYRFRVEWKDRLKIAKSLESTMSPEMLALIRSGEVEVNRGGELRNVTVMFADLANYTALSEKTSPEELVSILNEYLDEVVNLIFSHGGYVDKFIGDAVMAVWGAPVRAPEKHAERGLQAAIAFEEAVARFNKKIAERFPGMAELYARVGLHTGPAIVGNIGAKARFNYTAIGDNVNLASRLESLAKQYGCRLLVSGEVLQGLSQLPHGIFEVDEVRVKGKTASTKIFSTAGAGEESALASYERGLAAYRQERWSEARAQFAEASSLRPAATMLARCETALAGEIPEPYQKGVWNHDSK